MQQLNELPTHTGAPRYTFVEANGYQPHCNGRKPSLGLATGAKFVFIAWKDTVLCPVFFLR